MREVLHQQLSRRDILKAGLALGLGLTTRLSNTPRNAEAHESPVSIEAIEYLRPPRTIFKVEALALTVAQALSDITPYAPLMKNEEDVKAFEDEFVPYLTLTGFQDPDKLIVPQVTFADFGQTDGVLMGFYLMGESHCGSVEQGIDEGYPAKPPPDGSIKINERFFDEYSPMQRRDRNNELVAVLAHETCHSNNVSCAPEYFFGDPLMVEGTTQIAATNTLFAMSMDGSRIALPAALSQMKLLSRDWVWVNLYNQGKLDDYEAFLSEFPDHSLMEGDWNLMKAQGDVSGFINAAESYGRKPFAVMSNTMLKKNFETKKLPVPHDTLKLYHTNYVLSNLSHFVDDYIQTSPLFND